MLIRLLTGPYVTPLFSEEGRHSCCGRLANAVSCQTSQLGSRCFHVGTQAIAGLANWALERRRCSQPLFVGIVPERAVLL